MEDQSTMRITKRHIGRRIVYVLVLCAVVLFSFLSIFPDAGKADHVWSIETVDPQDYSGNPSSLEIDSVDQPHIAYHSHGALKYSYWTGISWNIQVVDSNFSVGHFASLSLDSSDHPHISYFDKDNGDLKYAHWNGSTWRVQVIDSEGWVGGHTSIDVDSNDNPHIAYGDGTNHDLKYAYWNGTGWAVETVDSAGDFGMFVTLALDSNDRPHVSYYDSGNGHVKYARWTGSNWTRGFVETGNSTGVDNSLALDSNDNPHVAYYDYTTACLKHAVRIGTEWEIEIVRMDSRSLGSYVSLTMDSDGKPQIAYRPATWGALLYITKNDTSWAEEVVDPATGRSVTSPSIALDSLNRPHISYGYESGDPSNLMYARTAPPPEPDLALFSTDVSITPSGSLTNGTAAIINATIHNIGGVNAWNVYARFYDGHPPSGAVIGPDGFVSLIPPEGHANFSTNWIAAPPGSHEICVQADPDDSIAEFDETNNLACKSIEVLPSSDPRPPTNLNARLSGLSYQDVTLTWDLSADDGMGSNSVVRYDLFRGEEYDSKGIGYGLLQSVPNGSSMYVDLEAGEGDPSNYFYYVCAANAMNNSSCTLIQVAKFTRPLSPGPNLVSIPLIQSDESMETVLQTVKYDRAWHYDSSSQEWKWYMKHKGYRRGLWNVNHTKGLWVDVTRNSNLTVAGAVPSQTTIYLYEGWNLVSFPSFNASHPAYDLKMDTGAIRVEGYDPSSPYHLRVLGDGEMLQAGLGYWVRVEADIVWAVGID